MRLYIANCTDQVQWINYRIPEKKNFQSQGIDIGRQAAVGADLNIIELEAVIKHLAIYGVRPYKDFEHAREKELLYPLLWNTDNPVPFETMMSAYKWNNDLLGARGKKMREEAAIATSVGMRNMTPNAANNMWMSVQEDKPGTMEKTVTVNDGVRISEEAV
jgi:hypothetical protein